MSDFIIRIASDDLLFSACHFITFEGGTCEPLHGHDYQVVAEVHSPLNSQHYVVDFVTLHEVVKGILKELDHRVLLPRDHPRIDIRTIGNELEVALGERRWVLPKQDCLLLPVPNTTSELLAQYITQRISQELSARKIILPKLLQVELRESNGFMAICQIKSDE
ncbi:MAG TPA: 6-carboxytetrahydropterin synthase [Thermoguttaceae bacterium]